MIVISPHLDDAVWSASAILEGATVVTICAGIPPEGMPPSEFDQRAGFKSAADAIHWRRREDHAAAAIGGFKVEHMGCLDNAYARKPQLIEDVTELICMWALHRGEQIVGPVGLRHPDHRRIASVLPDVAWRYEELPYAYVWPEEHGVNGTLECSNGADWKEAAVWCYRSQINPTTHLKEILSKERLHK